MYAGQCDHLPPLSNGNISYSFNGYPLRPYGTVATHTCNQGYTLSGDENRTCNNSEWLGTMPTCIGMVHCCIIYIIINLELLYSHWPSKSIIIKYFRAGYSRLYRP